MKSLSEQIEQVIFYPRLSEVRERYNIEQTPDETYKAHFAWLRKDIPNHGLDDAIEVAKDDDNEGYGIVNGGKRFRILTELAARNKPVTFNKSGQVVPIGSIPAFLSPFKGRDAYLQAFRENSSLPLSDLDLGRHFEKIIADIPHGDVEEEQKRLAKDLNLSQAKVEYCLALWRKVKGDEGLKQDLAQGKISTSHANVITKLKKAESQKALTKVTKEQNLTVEETDFVRKVLAESDKSLASEQELTEKARKVVTARRQPELIAAILDIADLPLIKKYCQIVVEAVKCPGCGSRLTHYQCTASSKKKCPMRDQDIKFKASKAYVSIGTDPVRFREACEKFLKTPLKSKRKRRR